MDNVATYSEARSEYTKQLATFVVPALVQWFQTLWGRNAHDKTRSMVLFQNECEEIPRWNTDRVHDEVRVLIERSGCDYMEGLMTAVFIAHTKILTAVRLSKKKQELSITVPKLDHFIHRIFREAARSFWKVPFLFQESGSVVERQKNVLQIEALAAEAISTAVRSLLPVKEILNRYLEADAEEVDDETEAVVVAPVSLAAPAAPAAPATPAAPAAPVAPATPVAEPDVSTSSQVSETPLSAPAIVQIDTEPAAVHFSDYDTVFKDGNAELEYKPKDADSNTGDDIDDGLLSIDEKSAKPIGADDAEDLDAPVAPPAPVKKPVSETIEADECDVLE